MKEKNILLTTLGYTDDVIEASYYNYTDSYSSEPKYCYGISITEAGTKHILSKHPLDGIVVIGPKSSIKEGDKIEEVALSDLDLTFGFNSKSYSEYYFYLYRISEFFNQIDIEYADISMILPLDQAKVCREKFVQWIEKESAAQGIRPVSFFNYLSTHKEEFVKVCKELCEGDENKIKLFRHTLFSILDNSYKMKVLDCNKDVNIQFIPTDKEANGHWSLNNLTEIINKLRAGTDEQINIYLDLQGLNITDGYMLLSVISMLKNDERNRIALKEVINLKADPTSLTNSIVNEASRYEINTLLSGVNSFIKYGKVDLIRDYWNSFNRKNERIEKMLYAMQFIDDGISLCQVTDLTYGIQVLKTVFNSPVSEEIPNEETLVISLIENGIRKDYGKLLEGDEIDLLELLKWAFNKKFYQQTLTMIESLAPEDFVTRGIYYYNKDQKELDRNLVVYNKRYWETDPKQRYSYNHPDHDFVKYINRSKIDFHIGKDNVPGAYADLRISQIDKKNPEEDEIVAHSNIPAENYDDLKNLLKCYYQIGNVRNTINHALGEEVKRSVDEFYANDNMELLMNAVKEFIDYYEKADSLLTQRYPQMIRLTGDALKDYANEHKIFSDSKPFGNKGGFGGKGKGGFNKKPFHGGGAGGPVITASVKKGFFARLFGGSGKIEVKSATVKQYDDEISIRIKL